MILMVILMTMVRVVWWRRRGMIKHIRVVVIIVTLCAGHEGVPRLALSVVVLSLTPRPR